MIDEPKHTTAEYLRAMASYGITSADVEFDGYGDDGQIVDITAEGIADQIEKVCVRPEHKCFSRP